MPIQCQISDVYSQVRGLNDEEPTSKSLLKASCAKFNTYQPCCVISTGQVHGQTEELVQVQ